MTDHTVSPAKITTTDYLSGAVYRNDTLQYLPTEEGRIRRVPAYQGDPGYWVWDYFVRDHLGNVRMVLTEQTDFSQYLATMETGSAAKEEALFYNLDETRTPRPMDYPEDQITTPNGSVARLNGRDPAQRIGPSIILKVMAGDTIEAAVRAYYRQEKEPQKKVTIPAEQLLTGLVQALVAPQGAAMAAHGRQALGTDPQTAGLTARDLQQLRGRDPEAPEENKPKGYLNYVFFDNNLNFVEEGSGAKGLEGEGGELETLASGKIGVKRSGYVYVFTSNESEEEVFFDNLGVLNITGPVLEETHYYPFGLVMDGISTVAPLKIANNYKYNGKELNRAEFSDGTGLEWYSYGYREYDPQIARFPQLDPLTHDYPFLTPYQYASNDPIANIDLDGLEGFNIIHSASDLANGFAFGVQGAEYTVTASKMTGSVLGVTSSISSLAGSAASIAGNVGEMVSSPNPSQSLFTQYETPDDKAWQAQADFYKDVDFAHGQLMPGRSGGWDAVFGHRQAVSGLYVYANGYPLQGLEQVAYAVVQRQAAADIASFSMLGGPLRMLGGAGVLRNAAKGGTSRFGQIRGGIQKAQELTKTNHNLKLLDGKRIDLKGRHPLSKGHYNKVTKEQLGYPHIYDPAHPGGVRAPNANDYIEIFNLFK